MNSLQHVTNEHAHSFAIGALASAVSTFLTDDPFGRIILAVAIAFVSGVAYEFGRRLVNGNPRVQ